MVARAAKSPRSSASSASSRGLTLVINLARRRDRLRTIRGVLRGRIDKWERVDAVDGRKLTWDGVKEHLRGKALAEAQWAEKGGVPTICTRTGSFSPHLTLGAVGCALSHRKAWLRLAASKFDYALILEDDVSKVAYELQDTLTRCVASLPSSWQLCLIGFHEASGRLLLPGERMRMAELGPDEAQTGLFGYLLRRSAVPELLSDVFPLAHQVDVELGMRTWRPMSRFALSPEATLIHAPKSEEAECDTDVQTLSNGEKKVHDKGVLKGMLLL